MACSEGELFSLVVLYNNSSTKDSTTWIIQDLRWSRQLFYKNIYYQMLTTAVCSAIQCTLLYIFTVLHVHTPRDSLVISIISKHQHGTKVGFGCFIVSPRSPSTIKTLGKFIMFALFDRETPDIKILHLRSWHKELHSWQIQPMHNIHIMSNIIIIIIDSVNLPRSIRWLQLSRILKFYKSFS